MSKIFLIILLFELLISKQRLFSKADQCVLDTECKHISECFGVRKNFHLYDPKPFCNLNQSSTYVCCRMPQPKYTTEKDNAVRSVKECKSYQRLRPRCEQPLIVGGKKAKSKEFPFMALLFYKKEDYHHWLCGGTLISSKYVLSAAHCFYETNNPNTVRLGELDYSTTTDDALPQDYAIKDYITHPQYFTTDVQTKYNDIALIQLTSEVTYNDYVLPACLPLVDGSEFRHYFATGWGREYDTASKASSHLLKVKLDRFDDSTCFEKVNISHELTYGVNNRTQMCAGSFDDNRDTCFGDSGGPLFIDHPDLKCLHLVLGVTSYADGGCGNAGQPAVYTRIQLYMEWIEQIIWHEPSKLSYG